VGGKDGALGVDPDAVHAYRLLFHSSPLLNDGFDGVPDLALQGVPGTTQLSILHAYHVCWRFPMVDVNVLLDVV